MSHFADILPNRDVDKIKNAQILRIILRPNYELFDFCGCKIQCENLGVNYQLTDIQDKPAEKGRLS